MNKTDVLIILGIIVCIAGIYLFKNRDINGVNEEVITIGSDGGGATGVGSGALNFPIAPGIFHTSGVNVVGISMSNLNVNNPGITKTFYCCVNDVPNDGFCNKILAKTTSAVECLPNSWCYFPIGWNMTPGEYLWIENNNEWKVGYGKVTGDNYIYYQIDSNRPDIRVHTQGG